MKLEVKEIQSGGKRVELRGALDRDTAPDIRNRLLKLARAKAVRHLELDFTNVSSMDSAGLAVLVELLIQLSHKGGDLRLTSLGENIQRMISMARLDQILPAGSSLNTGK